MILCRASFEFEEFDAIKILKNIEKAGRTCYKSEEKITDTSYLDFIQKLIKRGHTSVFDHEKITCRIICDRGISNEIVRHRIGAGYSQESTRFCDYKGSVKYIYPVWEIDKENANKLDKYLKSTSIRPLTFNDLSFSLPTSDDEPFDIWYKAMLYDEFVYTLLLQKGWSPQQARSVLPNSLKTEIVVTYSISAWLHFFELRTKNDCHPQMLELTRPMLTFLKENLPIIFSKKTFQ